MPKFLSGFCVPDRAIVADESGKLWVVDPSDGTLRPVIVLDEEGEEIAQPFDEEDEKSGLVDE